MTLHVTVRNDDPADSSHNVRVHRVFFTEGSAMAEDAIILKPGEERQFTIWNNVRLAVEEEYVVKLTPSEPPTLNVTED